RWGEPVVIGPYNAADRRLIHEHFRNDPEIETVSETGEEGGMKKMTLRLRTPATGTANPAPSS
ncbi:MAG: single-stranded DNA-binding protein, partial [Verrucomicrobiae bacterium]|nr:single-stranded DNA-binding protein [Verrucomicrobiae bacterium]